MASRFLWVLCVVMCLFCALREASGASAPKQMWEGSVPDEDWGPPVLEGELGSLHCSAIELKRRVNCTDKHKRRANIYQLPLLLRCCTGVISDIWLLEDTCPCPASLINNADEHVKHCRGKPRCFLPKSILAVGKNKGNCCWKLRSFLVIYNCDVPPEECRRQQNPQTSAAKAPISHDHGPFLPENTWPDWEEEAEEADDDDDK